MRSPFLAAAFLAGLTIVPAATAADDDKMAETPYYPLRAGTTWHYKSGGGKLSVRVARHEKVDGVLCARLEWLRDGKLCSVEHLHVTRGGVYRQDLQVLEPGKTELGPVQTLKPAILLLRLPPHSGDKWTVDYQGRKTTIKGTYKVAAEDVQVPAGSYKALRVSSEDLDEGENRIHVSCWYAEGAGLVKQQIEIDNTRIVIELEKVEQ